MLKKLRNKKTARKIWIVLCILILPAFVLWGLGGAGRDQKESQYIGKIFGKNISLLDFQDSLEAAKNQAIIQFGNKFSEIQPYLNLKSEALERLLLLAEAGKRKLNVANIEIVETIEKYPFFQRNGQFDNKTYSEMLEYVFRTQPRVFEEQTRQNLMLVKLYKEVTSDLSLNETQIQEEYRKANQEISMDYIASLPLDFQKELTVSDAETKEYFTKNSLQFKEPLSFNLEYVSLEDAERAKELFLRLKKKHDLTQVARELKLEAKVTGLFPQVGPIPGIGWSPELLNLLSNAKSGQILPILKLDKNYYILKIKEKKEPYIPDFEKIKGQVKESLLKDKSKKIAQEKIEACLKKIKDESRLNPAKIADFLTLAKSFGLKAQTTNMFKYGSYLEGVGASDNFWLTAKDLKENEISGIIQIPSGFYIIRLKSRSLFDEKKFASEKEDFSQKLLEQKKQEYFIKFVGGLKTKSLAF